MPNKMIIEFEMRVWKEGFFVTLEIPYSDRNLEAVLGLRGSANIRVLKK